MKFQVREVKVSVRVERLNDDGKVEAVGDVPAQVFEAQFDKTVESVVADVLKHVESTVASSKE